MTPAQMLGGNSTNSSSGSPNQLSQPSYQGGPNSQQPSQGQSASSGQAIAQQAQQQVQGVFQAAQQLKDQITQLAQSYPAGGQEFSGAAQACDEISQALLQGLGTVLGAMGSSATQPTQTQGMGL